MALNLVRGRHGARPMPAESLAIGDTDSDVFGCPVCTRPLAQGAGRCPGCGTRLVLGVAARRASAFVAIGAVLGMLAGGAVTVSVVSVSGSDDTASGGGAPAVAPTPSARPTPSPSRAPDNAVPSMARSALGQVGELHARMATGATLLQSSLAQPKIDVPDVAKLLRSLAADAAYGSDLAPRLRGWDEAESLSAELTEFYSLIRQTARDGLRASLTDGPAYQAAGATMLAALGGMASVDAEARARAADAEIEMPDLPSSLPSPAPASDVAHGSASTAAD